MGYGPFSGISVSLYVPWSKHGFCGMVIHPTMGIHRDSVGCHVTTHPSKKMVKINENHGQSTSLG